MNFFSYCDEHKWDRDKPFGGHDSKYSIFSTTTTTDKEKEDHDDDEEEEYACASSDEEVEENAKDLEESKKIFCI